MSKNHCATNSGSPGSYCSNIAKNTRTQNDKKLRSWHVQCAVKAFIFTRSQPVYNMYAHNFKYSYVDHVKAPVVNYANLKL
jgi:hypothetical protein